MRFILAAARYHHKGSSTEMISSLMQVKNILSHRFSLNRFLDCKANNYKRAHQHKGAFPTRQCESSPGLWSTEIKILIHQSVTQKYSKQKGKKMQELQSARKKNTYSATLKLKRSKKKSWKMSNRGNVMQSEGTFYYVKSR